MTPNDRRSRPDADEVTGITSIATKALLEGIQSDVRALRGEVADTSAAIIRVEERQTDLIKHVIGQDVRLNTIETDFRKHQADEQLWQLTQQKELEKVSTQLALVAPLTAAHEQVLQQAKGAAWATKALYLVAGAIGVGGIQAIIHLLTMGHK